MEITNPFVLTMHYGTFENTACGMWGLFSDATQRRDAVTCVNCFHTREYTFGLRNKHVSAQDRGTLSRYRLFHTDRASGMLSTARDTELFTMPEYRARLQLRSRPDTE